METRYLETLVAVADRGSMATAARQQGITATSVSQRIHALEADLKVQLVTRVGREIKLTAAGTQLLPMARSIVENVRSLTAVASNTLTGTLTGTLNIGAISSAITGLLPVAVETFATEHPGVQLNISPGASAFLHDGLMAGTYDAIIAVSPPFMISKTIQSRVLRSEPLVCLAPEKLDLLRSSSKIKQDSLVRTILETERFIRYDILSWGGRLCEAYLRDHRMKVRELCSLDGLEAIALLVERGLGVALVPDWAPPWPATPSCRKLVIADPTYAREIALCYPVNTRYALILNALIRAMAPQAAAMEPG